MLSLIKNIRSTNCYYLRFTYGYSHNSQSAEKLPEVIIVKQKRLWLNDCPNIANSHNSWPC